MDLIKRSGTYYLRVYRGGKQDLISTHKKTEKEAKKAAEVILFMYKKEKATLSLTKKLCQYVLDLAKSRINKESAKSILAGLEKQAKLEALEVVEKIFPAREYTADDLWEDYMSKPHDDIKESTMKTKTQRFMIFKNWCGDMDLKNLLIDDCRRFLESLNCSKQTWNNYVSDLSSIFSAIDGLNNPWGGKLRQTKVEHKETEAFDLETAKKVLSFCDEHREQKIRNITCLEWGNFLRTLYYSGLRPVDVCLLKKDEITDDGSFDLMPEKTSRTRKKVSYKIDPKLYPILTSINTENEDGLLFPGFAKLYKGNRSNPGNAFKDLLKKASIETSCGLYGFRHNFVTYQMEQGNEDESVSAAVGHSSTSVTKQHYYHGKKNIVLSDLPEI
jgi:integrase